MKKNIAIIVGGSVAGLCTAAALAPFFKKVIILERDSSPESRKGTPQMHHVHVLLVSGIKAMEQLLPGLTDELLVQGSIPTNLQNDFNYLIGNCWMKRHMTADRIYLQHRKVIDHAIRTILTRNFPNVEIRWGITVTGIEANKVHIDEEVIVGDFTVDASGRFSKFIEPYIVKSYVTNVDLMYSTMEFSNVRNAYSALALTPLPNHPSGLVILKTENLTFLATAFGYHEGKPGVLNDVNEWIDFLRNLPNQSGVAFLKNATPIYDKPKNFAYKAVKRNIFANLPFLVVGDADCSFDPVFGQGMSKAAKQAVAIKNAFAKKGSVNQKDIEHIVNFAHFIVTLEASRYKQVSGYTPPYACYMLPLFDLVVKAASVDDKVYDRMLKVLHLDASPFIMIKVLPRVIWHAIFTKIPQALP